MCWVLVVVAAVAIVLALLVGYVRRAAVDSDQFANFYRRGDLMRAVDALNGIR